MLDKLEDTLYTGLAFRAKPKYRESSPKIECGSLYFRLFSTICQVFSLNCNFYFERGDNLLYEKVTELCKAKGVSIARLERDCELGNATVRNWRNLADMPRYSTLKRVADYLGVSVDELVGSE